MEAEAQVKNKEKFRSPFRYRKTKKIIGNDQKFRMKFI
ncbi:hypothetical protein LEP1GSC193_0226 [Leptospira alstonii serovar Pingchang str. 80-412]|uniref:Uncharacterized protein n=2 Tax=Leptospira alstonii TaxID=28452 RepID=M6DCK6_9LEPT|nr:hypothetical protein LEP1GSC194_3788 [Leptospira alstonii serovar Sichuan str. 79601]EQA78989.1 hypothetical protein LEP1GSC193_0226 [Leptospira alstonii serovar Pingchang str. 80-412]